VGELVEFSSNQKTCGGYLAAPDGRGPGVVVIQEWWGLVDHIKDVCERFAAEGFVALAPDLFRGETTKEPTEGDKLMMELKIEQAAKDTSGAVDFLLDHEQVQPKKVGCVGFCMGGALSIWLATLKPIDACVVYYGGPYKTKPDYSKLKAPVLGHFAEHDDWATPQHARQLFENIKKARKQGELHIYPGTTHAFFNDTRKEDVPKRVGSFHPQAAHQSWERTLAFFRQQLM
jgi:carboxymethylenebutenolidase